jgi:chromosome partitioning protein
MPQAIAFLNRKGGVGKTSSVHHLAGALAKAGHSVLTVDMDAQRSLTQGFFGIDGMASIDPGRTVLAAFLGDPRSCDDLAFPTAFAGITLLAGSDEIERYDLRSPEKQPARDQTGLADVLAESTADYILIDCPPTLRGCAWAALAAADALVVPVQPEDYGSQGIIHVQAFLNRAREQVNANLELAGYLLTMVQRTSLHRIYERTIREAYGSLVFEAVIPRAIVLAEAISQQQPICHSSPRSAASKAVDEVAAELVSRLTRLAAGQSLVTEAP